MKRNTIEQQRMRKKQFLTDLALQSNRSQLKNKKDLLCRGSAFQYNGSIESDNDSRSDIYMCDPMVDSRLESHLKTQRSVDSLDESCLSAR